MMARRPWRSLLALTLLALPFCACHAALVVDSGDGCCHVRAANGFAVRTASAGAQPRAVAERGSRAGGDASPSAGHERAATCASSCCRGAAPSDDEPAPDDGAGSAEGDIPEPSPERERPRPGCSNASCCVKSAPQAAPWQMPALFVVDFLDVESTSPMCVSHVRAAEWPPTLPLGQPPSPVERGTLLLV